MILTARCPNGHLSTVDTSLPQPQDCDYCHRPVFHDVLEVAVAWKHADPIELVWV